MEFNPQEHDKKTVYKLLTATVIPRPIAWVSTQNKEGQHNLAPFSFFNAFAASPPTVVLGIGSHTATTPKDTLANIRETGEFVINVVTADLAEQMNLSAVVAPNTLNEYKFANVTPAPSVKINAPRVAESPVNYECILKQIIQLTDVDGGHYLVIGEVVYGHFADDIMLPDYKIDMQKLDLVGRLAGTSYSTTRDTFDLTRPPTQLK